MTGSAERVSVVVMGVSAAGKSSVGAALAQRLGLEFIDGDDLHSAQNRAKMASGTPLNDEDREPWLDVVGRTLAHASGDGLVVACSALRRRYRERIRSQQPSSFFIHLDGAPGLLAARAAGRSDHFMPSSLLDSQLATLEGLEADERGVRLDVSGSVSEIVDQAIAALSLNYV